MRFLILIVIGIVSGIFAGMGMGGGTFLVPLLYLFFKENQVVCQSTNIFCFVAISVVCVLIYSKKKLIDFKVVFLVGIPAMIVSGIATIFSLKFQSRLLQILFACFVILVGIYLLFFELFLSKKTNKNK